MNNIVAVVSIITASIIPEKLVHLRNSIRKRLHILISSMLELLQNVSKTLEMQFSFSKIHSVNDNLKKTCNR